MVFRARFGIGKSLATHAQSRVCEIPGCASERPGAAWQLTLTYELLEVNEDLVVRASETLGKKYV